MMTTTKRTNPGYARQRISWMIRRDMPCVLAIEGKSFEYPWTEQEFIRVLRQRYCIGMICIDSNECVIGYMIYELHKNRLHILNFAVDPLHRRSGVGAEMIETLVSKLAYQRRNRIVCEIRESNLDAQLFFRAMGFRANGVLKSFYEDTPEDAYMFQYRLAASVADTSERKTMHTPEGQSIRKIVREE